MKKMIIILGVAGASLSAIFVRFSTISSSMLVFYRLLFAVLLLSPAAIGTHRGELRRITKRQLLMCMLSGIFLGLHFILYFESLSYTSITSSVVLVDTEIFFVALGGIFFLHETQAKLGWLSIVITFAGSVVVAMGDAGGGQLLGDVIALGGAACVAVYTLIGRKMRANMSTTAYTWIVYFCAGCVVAVVTLCKERTLVCTEPVNLLCGLGLAVFCTLLGHSIFSWGLKYEKASFVSMAKLLEPVFASILGILFFREMPTITSVLGGLMIIGGLALYAKID